MSSWLFLSRVLLSLALVVNAMAPVAASTRMNVVLVQAATTAVHADAASEDMPCHPRHALLTTADAPSPVASTPGDSTQPGPDSCKSGACACACVHPGHAALPTILIALGRAGHQLAIGTLPLAHGAPELHHLIRPPIG